MDADAAVIGGGPAGLAAASHLAALGADVVLVDAGKPLNNGKPCGGYIPARLAERLFPGQPPGYEVSAIHLVYQDREWTVELGETAGYNIPRRRLIEALERDARSSGAEIIQGCTATASVAGRTVTVHACGEAIRARVLVAADGAASRIGAAIRGRYTPETLGIALQAAAPRADVPRGANTIMLGSSYSPGGYAWAFPKHGHVDIGVGALAAKAPGGTLSRYLARVAERLHAEPRGPRYAPVPLSGPRRAARGAVLLAGDAAGHVSPLTGEGVRYAIEAGWAAARAAWGYLRGRYGLPAMGARYHAYLWGSFYPGLWLERRLMEHFLAGGGSGRLLGDPGARRVVAMLYADAGGQVSRLLRGLAPYLRARLRRGRAL